MNREIKFRAKRLDDHPLFWAVGQYVETPLTSEFNADGQFFDTGVGRHCIVQDHCAHEVDGETLDQYTGLKDKNGKDIFEGDVLRMGYSLAGMGASPYYPTGVVYWTERLAGYEVWDEGADHVEDLVECYEEAEVIGNIYENPELASTQDES